MDGMPRSNIGESRDDHDVGRQQVLVRADEVVEVGAAHLLLALDEELHVHRQAAVLLHVRLDRP